MIGLALLGLPFVPPEGLGGFDGGPPWTDDVSAWVLGLLTVAAVGIAGGRLLRDVRIDLRRLQRDPFLVALIAGLVAGLMFWRKRQGDDEFDEEF